MLFNAQNNTAMKVSGARPVITKIWNYLLLKDERRFAGALPHSASDVHAAPDSAGAQKNQDMSTRPELASVMRLITTFLGVRSRAKYRYKLVTETSRISAAICSFEQSCFSSSDIHSGNVILLSMVIWYHRFGEVSTPKITKLVKDTKSLQWHNHAHG